MWLPYLTQTITLRIAPAKEVIQRRPEQIRVIVKLAKASITITTQKIPKLPRVVVMVDRKTLARPALLTANRTKAFL